MVPRLSVVATCVENRGHIDERCDAQSIIAQKHPSLRAYKHQIALLQAQLSHWQHKTKFARNQIRNLLSSFMPTDPSHAVYSAQLTLISFLTTPVSNPKLSSATPASSPAKPPTTTPHQRSGTSSPQPSPQDVHAALAAVQELEDRATHHNHNHVALLARVLNTRIRVAAGMWGDLRDTIRHAEAALGLSYEPASTPKPRKPLEQSQGNGVAEAGGKPGKASAPVVEQTFIMFENPFEAAMAVHLLMLAVVYYTHAGEAAEVSPRLSHLHALLDSEVLEKFPDGYVEIALPDGPSLVVQVTHPRILFLLGFLISSTSKRDAVGRKPKRKVFATEGLATWDVEASREISFSLWASAGDVQEVEERLARIKADLLCEVVAVSIMRSEFDTAEENLDTLIAHTRTYNIFPLFSARIALHHAHLAHALARPARALRCYHAAAQHSDPDSFVHIAARAGEAALCVGIHRRRTAMGDTWREGLSTADDEWPEGYDDWDFVEARGREVLKTCRGMGGALEAIGQVLESCFTPEILKSKYVLQHLKHALELATKAQDNHLRALVLALVSAHYLHTAGDHARAMLQTCEQLAAGLGATAKAGASANSGPGTTTTTPTTAAASVGNAPLGLWVGERFLELYKRYGKEARVQKQMVVNARLAKAVEELAQRPA
uniref:Probable 3-oxoacyl-[acyl-carrier-protein] reductase oxidoreductase (EC) n=1 Tax=Ganoderma boninense TaxID=34458 RepID=A0A5K1JYP9_9APHY|nr:Probable 3-oxoacyl-[acyl-carrier-protein] reductase oxidoreductase (EC [Ganoderma boninense]